MLPYKSKLRKGTVIIRVALTVIAALLFLIGFLASVGMILTGDAQTSALLFTVGMMTLGFFIFKGSGWSIRQYIIHSDKLEETFEADDGDGSHGPSTQPATGEVQQHD